jgi:hypothetical protein
VPRGSRTGAINCGVFRALPLDGRQWEISCSKLPDWRQIIEATEDEAAMAVETLQAEYRDTWEVAN